MKVLLISYEDACRSRIAEFLLSSFGRGMQIQTAGISEASRVPDLVREIMDKNGHDISCAKPTSISACVHTSWDYVITLCKEAEDALKELDLRASHIAQFQFDDPFNKNHLAEEEEIESLYDEMDRVLYRFYRDELREQLLPRCSCGANTFCRCQ